MLRTLLFLQTFLFCCADSFTQTFMADSGEAIRDELPLVSILNVSGLPDSIQSKDFGVESVCLNITYWEVNHLIVTLYAPDGTMVKLIHLNGRDEADHFANTCFGEKGKYFPFEHPPYSGGYQPILPLGIVNNGQNPNGAWRLVVEEYKGQDYEGTLDSWSIIFGKHPAKHDTILKRSDLPIFVINTNGQHIPDEPKINARLRVSDNLLGEDNRPDGPFNGFDGAIGIEWHGASSKSFWQQSFGIETRDAEGEDLDVPLLGLPPGSDWILHGPFSDKSLLRNALTLSLADEAANTEYVPRARFCEVVLNGSYLGVYTLMEKIKRGPQRVDIAKIRKSDVFGDALTGGYIVKVDRKDDPGWFSPHRPEGGGRVYFNYVYPKANDIQPEQAAYIQAFVDSFETALLQSDFADAAAGWRRFADEPSFVEHFLFNEVCKNVDAYRLSGYLFKPRDSEGGKLHAGPLWDFNLAWRNANYADNENPIGWTFHGEPRGVPFWWEKLLSDKLFAQNLHCRWYELRQTVLSQRHIFSVIDSLNSALGAAKERQYELYPILGKGLWPNPKPIAKTHDEEIANMKIWVNGRLQWLDSALSGLCDERPNDWQPSPWLVFPNPASEQLTVFFETLAPAESVLELTDVAGRVLIRQTAPQFQSIFDLSGLANGLYLLIHRNKDGTVLQCQKVVKV